MRSPGKDVCQPQCESVKVLSPEITIAQGQGIHYPEASIDICVKGKGISTCRGLRPWRANELSISELGRTETLRKEAAKKLNKSNEAVWRFGSRTS
jgi:hypothetical protein